MSVNHKFHRTARIINIGLDGGFADHLLDICF